MVRIITSSKPRDNAQPLYEELGIIKFLDINKYLIGRFMFRYCKGQLPRLFDTDFENSKKLFQFSTSEIFQSKTETET